MFFLPAFVGFIFGTGLSAIAFMIYIDTKLKPKLWAAERRLSDLERWWDSPHYLSVQLAEVSIKERQAHENAKQAAIITVAVRNALKNA